eukprot:GAFH01001149.1.p1 GENE.GAFH01001149.1~~GAFH01001149.1.p1  ORF type:complete len:453 (-),score=169.96 GAFH01001149.1:542-1864(-)
MTDQKLLVVAITGGCGFLGQHLANHVALHWPEVGHIKLIAPHPPKSPILVEEGKSKFEYVKADCTHSDEILEALKGVDFVFHLAARVDWGQNPPALVRNVNINGVQNTLDAAQKLGIRALVSTSSIETITIHGRSLLDAPETHPYSTKRNSAYGLSKVEGERRVVRANKPGVFNTAVIRPLAMYGPADPYQCPAFVKNAQAGNMVARIGDGSAVFHTIYVENVAHGLLLLAKRVWAEAHGAIFPEVASGQVFHVTDEPANNLFDRYFPVMEGVCNDIDQTIPAWDTAPLYLGRTCAEMPPVPALVRPDPVPGKKRFRMPRVKIPFLVAYLLACLVDLVYFLTGLVPPLRRLFFGTDIPALNRTSTTLICTPISVNGEKARRVLGYAPVVDQAEAYRRTIGWFRAQVKAGRPLTIQMSTIPSSTKPKTPAPAPAPRSAKVE